MFAVKFAIVITCIVLVGHKVNGSCGCGGGLLKGLGLGGWRSPTLSGAETLYNGGVRLLESGGNWADGRTENGWTETRTENGNEIVNNCAPLVVRPQEVPKPALPLPASLIPVPGPCACKRAIVKPAILPRPVYRPPVLEGGLIGAAPVVGVIGTNYNQNINSQSSSALLGGIGGAAGIGSGDYRPIVLDKNGAYPNQADFAPADAVSIALAQKNAQQQYAESSLSEDRLAFGFRKIPQEIPIQKVVRQNNIPEEKIFSLNGQIVELKPVKVCNEQTLEEEAAEDLLALQEEETAALSDAEGTRCACGSPFRISLGELGYGPAKSHDKTFIDVPAPAIDAAADAIGEVASSFAGAAGEAASSFAGAVGGALSSAAGALGLGDSKSKGCNPGFAPGNVVYKTVPKLSQIPIPSLPDTLQDTTDCESQEAGEEQSVIYDDGYASGGTFIGSGSGLACGTCCMPCCTGIHQNVIQKSSSSASSSTSSSSSLSSFCPKRASVLIEKLKTCAS